MLASLLRKNGTRSRFLKTLLVLLLIQFCLNGCRRKEAIDLPPPPAEPATTTIGIRTSYAEVVTRASAAVVTIRTKARVHAPRQYPFRDDPYVRRFFEDGLLKQPEQPQRGLASGVIVSTDGYILTNAHVINGAEEILVELRGQRNLAAKLVGSDSPSDLAVLKIERSGLSALALADSDKVQVGDIVLAIGNQLDIGQTVTMGIISAKSSRTGLSNGSFEDFLQTDAPINRGNSGGALVDGNGSLIGINSQLLSPSGGSIGVGFAIPSNMARDVLDQLVKHGKVSRGDVGIVVQPVTEDISVNLGLSTAKGLIVSQVQKGSAAERAGMQRGDVILALNGTAVSEPNAFRNDIAGTPPGRTVTLRIWRGGNEAELRATLGEFIPVERPQTEQEETPESQSNTGKLGLALQPLTPALAQELGLPADTRGLAVMAINPVGPAAEAGIQRGDVIEEVNQQPVRTVAELRELIQRSGAKPLLLLVNHRGVTVFVTIET